MDSLCKQEKDVSNKQKLPLNRPHLLSREENRKSHNS